MRRKLILLVEDNPDDEVLTLRAFNESNISTKVVVVHNGAEALEYLFGTGAYLGRDVKEMPDLTLLDLKLPKVDGLEVLKRMRADPRTSLIPVVVLTTSDEAHDIISSYENGANSYVRKPVNFMELLDVVRQLGLYWLVLNVPPPPRDNPALPGIDGQMKPEQPL